MKRYQRNPQIAARIIDGEAFAVTTDSKLHALNEQATVLWDHLKETVTAEELATELVKQFQVEMPQALQDVKRCLDNMVARQLVVLETN